MYILPSLIYRIILFNNLSLKKIIKKAEIQLSNYFELPRIVKNASFLNVLNINFISQILLNISFFLLIWKISIFTDGNIFKLPISISLICNFFLLFSRITTAQKYYLNNYKEVKKSMNLPWLFFFYPF